MHVMESIVAAGSTYIGGIPSLEPITPDNERPSSYSTYCIADSEFGPQA